MSLMSSSLIRRLESPSEPEAAASPWEAAGAWGCGAKGVLKGLWVLGTPSNWGALPAGALAASCAVAAGAAAPAGAAVASVSKPVAMTGDAAPHPDMLVVVGDAANEVGLGVGGGRRPR